MPVPAVVLPAVPVLFALAVLFAPTMASRAQDAPGRPSNAASATAAFALRGSVPTGPMPGRPVLCDIDRDGDLDVLLGCGTCCGSPAHPDSGHVLALLNDGRGALAAAPQGRVVVGPSARKIAVGDFDEDGAVDVAVAQHDLDEVVVLFGDGSGAFTARGAGSFVAARSERPHTHDIAASDLDGDGHLDLVTTQCNAGRLGLLRGDGKGGFAAMAGGSLAFGVHPYDAVLACDLDGDGRVDLVAPDLIGNQLVVRRNAGGRETAADGMRLGFDEPAFASLGKRPAYLSGGDLDGDGVVDLVATHDDVGLIAVLRGDGRGGFHAMGGSPLLDERPAFGTVLEDLDGDDDLDLAVGRFAGPPSLYVNDGDGRFRRVRDGAIPDTATGWYVAAGDLDGDGRADLVVTDYMQGSCAVVLATGAGLDAAEDASMAMDRATAAATFRDDFAEPDALAEAWNWVRATQGVDELVAAFEREVAAAADDDARCAAEIDLARVLCASSGTAASGRRQLAERVEAMLEAVLAKRPDDLGARLLYARALAQWPPRFGKRQQALDAFSALARAVESVGPRPEHGVVFACWGTALRDTDRMTEAKQVWRRGAELCGESALLARLIRAGR